MESQRLLKNLKIKVLEKLRTLGIKARNIMGLQ